jgi:hypothetical protein
MSFRVGQKVVCVDDNWGTNRCPGEVLPVKRSVYTIRGFEDCDATDPRPAIWLEEIVNPVRHDGEVSFVTTHFRPAQKFDISIFTAMLTKAPERVT